MMKGKHILEGTILQEYNEALSQSNKQKAYCDNALNHIGYYEI